MPIKPEASVDISDPDLLEDYLKPFGKLPRGDLYVRFDVMFPSNLTSQQKQQIVDLL